MSCLVDAKSDFPFAKSRSARLIEAELVAPAIVELCRARRGVVRHRRGLSRVPPFLRYAVIPGRAKAVIAQLGRNAGRDRAPGGSLHRRFALRQHGARQFAGAAADRTENSGPLGIVAQDGPVE